MNKKDLVRVRELAEHQRELAGSDQNQRLLSYGCCEGVHAIWEKSVSQYENLRKVSISPWCDEAYMGSALQGRKVAFHRKPSPNFIGVERHMEEDLVRAAMEKTVSAAKGLTLEF